MRASANRGCITVREARGVEGFTALLNLYVGDVDMDSLVTIE